MAFHDGLTTTQQILLAIVCFPLLPFYLCYLCFADSEKSKGKPDTLAQVEEGKVQVAIRQPQSTVVTGETSYYGQQSAVASETDQGKHTTVEIHPRQTTSQIGKEGSFNNGIRVFPHLRGQDNKVVTGETRYYGQQSAVASETDQGKHITVEIHPRQTTPQIGKEGSFNNGIRVFPHLRGQDNKGFQGYEEERSSLPDELDLYRGQNLYEEERSSLPNEQDLYTGQNLYEEERVSVPDEQELYSGQNLYAYPWDKSSLKSMPVDLQQFKKLDAYASKVNVMSSVEDLVSVLLQEAHSDLEKLRAIWIWICYHIEYDVKGYHDKTNRSCEPRDVLRSRKSVCAGYAGLFEQMCSIAGIQCKKLSGYSKGHGYKPGHVFVGDTDHAWNAVFLHGRWHLLDSTWGSGTVDNSCTKFTFRYNEFYFLTHPALFITDHFPEDSNMQFLKPCLTLEQFERNIRYTSAFYAEGLVAATPATTIIQTENGKATIFVESHSPALFLFELNKAKENCLMTLQRNGMKLDVYPQQTGTHSLHIYAKHSEDTKENYSHVLEYSLKCGSVDNSIHLPKDLIQPVGPSWLTEQAGVLKAFPSGPVIHTDDGCCVVTFTCTKDLHFFATLQSDNSRIPEDTMRRHVWKTCRGNQAELKIRLPHAGHFALLIWAKKTSDPGNHQCALSYLLSCPNKSVTWPVFPQSFANWEDSYELVAPLAGVLPANCQVPFKLKLPGVLQARVECGGKILPLTLSKDGFWEGTCNTSGGTKVTVTIAKDAGNTLWFLLEYKVETH